MIRPACWIGIVVATLSLPSLGQERVLFLNAEHDADHYDVNQNEGRTCVIARDVAKADYTCPPSPEPKGYFVQGHRLELEVFNRRFLTDYTFSIDGVTTIQSGPAIRNLNEAENLTLGPGTFASLATAKGGTEGLSARTAPQILLELMDEATVTQPKIDLDSDFVVVQRERTKIEAQVEDLRQHYLLILGTNPPPNQHNCKATLGSPSIAPLSVCLGDEEQTLHQGVWDRSTSPTRSFPDEQEFRNVNTRVQDLIAAMKTLGGELATTDLPSKLKSLEVAVAQYDGDVNIFRGNAESAARAVHLTPSVSPAFRQKLHRQEVKALLLDKLKGPDGKPIIDEAELNELLDSYYRTAPAPRAKSDAVDDSNKKNPTDVLKRKTDEYLSFPDKVDTFHNWLTDFESDINVKLPAAIKSLNENQSKLLNRVNYIYDHSEVSEPLPKQIDLSKNTGNLIVYFTIRRVENFQRYTVAQVQEPGAPGQANVVGTPLPPAAPAASASAATLPAPAAPPVTTTTTTGAAAPTTTPATPAPADTTQGTVVAKGAFEVHDVYHANVVAAIAWSSLKDQAVTAQAQPQGCIGTTTTPDPSCFSPLVTNSYRWTPIVGLDYYFQPRDTFPRSGEGWFCRTQAWQCFGVMGAASATKANDYFLGGFFEPALGVQFGAGVNFGIHTVLQSPYKANSAVDLPSGTTAFPTTDQRGTGFFVAAGLDLGIFRKIFGKFTGIGTSATSTGQ